MFGLQLRMAVPGHFLLVSLVCVQITTENGGPWSLSAGVPGLCSDYN